MFLGSCIKAMIPCEVTILTSMYENIYLIINKKKYYHVYLLISEIQVKLGSHHFDLNLSDLWEFRFFTYSLLFPLKQTNCSDPWSVYLAGHWSCSYIHLKELLGVNNTNILDTDTSIICKYFVFKLTELNFLI